MKCRQCKHGELWEIRLDDSNRAERITVCEACDQGCDQVSSPILVARGNDRLVRMVPG
jgi:hypothetical protein